MDQENIIRVLIFVVSFFLGVWLCERCSSSGPGPDQDTSTGTEVIHRSSDTVSRSTTDTVVRTRWKVDTVREPDTVYVNRDSQDHQDHQDDQDHQDHREITTEYHRKDLKATVNTRLRGEFLGQDMSYDVLCEDSVITRTDSVFIRDSIHTEKKIYPDKWRLGLGGFAGGNKNTFGAGPEVSLSDNSMRFGYGYDLVNGTHRISLVKKLDF